MLTDCIRGYKRRQISGLVALVNNVVDDNASVP
jgi:hypothetical protein